MRKIMPLWQWRRLHFCSGLILLCLLMDMCIYGYGEQRVLAVPAPTNTIEQVTQQVLLNIRQNGWNQLAQSRGVTTGGLYINWNMATPTLTNNGGNMTPVSHDPLVDLTYLNALVLYKTLHAQDNRYDTDVQKILPLVTFEYANYNLPKGTPYFYLLRTGTLLNSLALLKDAYTAAQNYYTNWYNPALGLIYDHVHLPASYNTEHILNSAVALIDAGIRWNQPAWKQAGINTLNTVLAAAIDPRTHLLYDSMLINTDGTQQPATDQAKVSEQGTAVEMLVDAYRLTSHQLYLDVAGLLLQNLFNGGLWDQANGGLFFALYMNSNQIVRNYKETRGETHTLIGLYRYNQLQQSLGHQPLFIAQQQQLTTLLTNNFYQNTYHGFFYRVTSTYGIYTSPPGKGVGLEDYFTTEAMGTALDALEQVAGAPFSTP